MPSDGTADIYLDGRLHRTVDVYSDEDADRSDEAVWHVFGLAPGEHQLRLVARGEPYHGKAGEESSGSEISLSYLLAFR